MHIRKSLILFIILLLNATNLFPQAGSKTFMFMDLPMSARLNALGGHNVSIKDGDISMMLNNPALLSNETHKVLQLNYAYLMQNINFASAIYAHNYNNNYFAAGIHYLNYGKMQYADSYGQRDGRTFTAQDILLNLTYARWLNAMFTVGVSLKPIYSAYGSYSSFALGADVGGHFQTKDKTFQLGISLQNIGWQLKSFYSDENGQVREKLPLNLQLGLNYKFAHAPIRISMTIHNMQRWNLNYQLTNQLDTETANKKITWYDMMFRHTIFAIDIVPKTERFYVTLSYNHRRRMEMGITDLRSLAGFALGAGVRIKQFRLSATFTQYTKGQYILQIGVSTDINQLMK